MDHIQRTPLDYGSLLCKVSNEVGSQRQPCLFHLSPALPPARVSLCSLSHEDMISVRVICDAGDMDMDLEAVTFLTEVWRTGWRRPAVFSFQSS